MLCANPTKWEAIYVGRQKSSQHSRSLNEKKLHIDKVLAFGVPTVYLKHKVSCASFGCVQDLFYAKICMVMEVDAMYFEERKEKAHSIYTAQKSVYNPYLKTEVIFNSDGFHHLQFSARRERNKKEQLLKFSLLPLAIDTIKKSGTLQEYRTGLTTIGKMGKDGLTLAKQTEYWGFVAIVGESKIKIKVILRRVGDGNVTFWSVMPFSKLKGGQKLYTNGIEEE